MLRTRILTAICLLAGLLAALFFLDVRAFSLLMLGVMTLGAYEWAKLVGLKTPVSISAYTAAIAAIGFVLWYFMPSLQPEIRLRFFRAMFTIMLPFWFLIVPMKLIGSTLGRFPRTTFLSGPLVLLSAWLAMTWLRDLGPYWLLTPFVIAWTADSSAYFVGRRYGKHPLAPTISPAKTREGALGAFAGVLVIGILTMAFLPLPLPLKAPNPFMALIALALLTIVSILGDLFESLLKRRAGIKDSGAILPGHGGVLDRIDALLAVLPVFAWISIQMVG